MPLKVALEVEKRETSGDNLEVEPRRLGDPLGMEDEKEGGFKDVL